MTANKGMGEVVLGLANMRQNRTDAQFLNAKWRQDGNALRA